MAKKKYDAVATIGKYNDRDGNEKKRYLNIGTVFENEEGNISMKIDAIPVGQEWSGWISFFIPKERDISQHEKEKVNGYQKQDDEPF